MKKETKYEKIRGRIMSVGEIICVSFEATVARIERIHKFIHVFERSVKRLRKKKKK